MKRTRSVPAIRVVLVAVTFAAVAACGGGGGGSRTTDDDRAVWGSSNWGDAQWTSQATATSSAHGPSLDTRN